MRWVLGIGGSNHDFSACLLGNGKPHAIIEDERLTGVRHGRTHWAAEPARPAADYCLESAGIELGSVEALFISNDMEGHAPFWMDHDPQVVAHHLCHGAAAYYASSFPAAGVLVVDGRGGPVGEIEAGARRFETISVGEGDGRNLTVETLQSGVQRVATSSWRYISTNSLGWFYSIVTECVGMGEDGEGKTMALAAYGEPRYRKDFERFLDLGGPQIFEMDPYSGLWSFLTETVHAHGGSFAVRADLAATAQAVLEDALVMAARHVRRQTGQRYLVYSGGVSLNGVANYRIRREAGFEDIFVFPGAGDNGLSVGAALYGWHGLMGEPRTERTWHDVLDFGYGGRPYSDEAMEAAARRYAVSIERIDDLNARATRLLDYLQSGAVAAVFQGGSEFGPRALGHRSLIALPDAPDIQRRLNRIKRRESFRPFAPIVLQDHAETYFELDAPSPFMLEIAPIKKAWHRQLAGAAHVDGTARLQTLAPGKAVLIGAVLERLVEDGAPPVVINTSFNLKGRPIVETPDDALEAFIHLDIEVLVLGPFWIEKQSTLETPQ